jgi:hypothetical protein
MEMKQRAARARPRLRHRKEESERPAAAVLFSGDLLGGGGALPADQRPST